MDIHKNNQVETEIEEFLSRVPIRLGVNKYNELKRLLYEICLRDSISCGILLKNLRLEEIILEGKNDVFHKLKKRLIWARYPSFKGGLKTRASTLGICRFESPSWNGMLSPKKIFIEKSVRNYTWTNDFIYNFPSADIREIETFRDVEKSLSKMKHAQRYSARQDNIFLVKNKDAFIKSCPCTKKYKSCAYWVLNIGFGCPIDCSYCFLQLYSNSPGIILPANIEDYYEYIRDFDKRARGKIRIGTGEFTDSLAFDRYTKYSRLLISFFKELKYLTLELKTKTSEIGGLLDSAPNDNIVVSWSMNTDIISDRYERGADTIAERISAAIKAARKGYKIGFHFDPIVFYRGWHADYKNIIARIFSNNILNNNTAWISLGTLRYTPGLKEVAEERFFDNRIYYEGEFFIDDDGKFRYPEEIRKDIYGKMIEWVRAFNKSVWIYLCMEPKEMWSELGIQDWK
ncbi:DNA repair photolyase-like protein [Candidatus Omnitrophus magneticus]|uniref:DNA repair photolyase-like protein n=1 Tax=Candidatus Omnitrophus magneticus TaxID=1609969 RepID=A0A0F0CP13_9BACT|nr:DNA repair photolyase-like protein [Candidatus Omnitrophus magneticus]